MKKLIKTIWSKTINLFKYLWHELKDWHTFVLFIIVIIVVGVEVWLPILLGIIFDNGWLIAFGSACEAFWIAPLTPFLPICIAITLAIKKPIDKLRERRRKNGNTNKREN